MIVEHTLTNPYYSLLYFDPIDKKKHIGYSSYDVRHTLEWLEEFFGVGYQPFEIGDIRYAIIPRYERPVRQVKVAKIIIEEDSTIHVQVILERKNRSTSYYVFDLVEFLEKGNFKTIDDATNYYHKRTGKNEKSR